METKTIISSTEARQKFSEILDSLENSGQTYTLTVNGKAKAVLVNAEEFEAMQETLEIMGDPRAIRAIKKSLKQIEGGEVISLEELLGAGI